MASWKDRPDEPGLWWNLAFNQVVDVNMYGSRPMFKGHGDKNIPCPESRWFGPIPPDDLNKGDKKS